LDLGEWKYQLAKGIRRRANEIPLDRIARSDVQRATDGDRKWGGAAPDKDHGPALGVEQRARDGKPLVGGIILNTLPAVKPLPRHAQGGVVPRLRKETAPPPAPIPGPHVIVPNAVYTLRSAAHALGLRKNCLPREIRLRRLKCHRRANQKFLLGEDILEWLRAVDGHGKAADASRNPEAA
jgi:hypothetical protein